MNFKTIRNLALVLVATAAVTFGAFNASASRIALGGLTTLDTSTHLDPMFVDLYDLREQVSTPSYTAASPKFRVDSSGNWSVGAPSIGWGSTTRAVNVSGTSGSVASIADVNGEAMFGHNAYFDGTNWRYISTGLGTLMQQSSAGDFRFYVTSSGTSGGVVTWTQALTLQQSGSLQTTAPVTFGYGTGSGGTVTQATSKSTAVTLNKPTGQITMNAATLAASTTVLFTVSNSLVAAPDTPVCNRVSGGTAGAYQVWVDSTAAGSYVIAVRNTTGGALAEAVVLQCNVIKGATS